MANIIVLGAGLVGGVMAKDLAKNHNIQEVDLEGVNSPERGWFKLSFGGDLRCYHQVYFPSSRVKLNR